MTRQILLRLHRVCPCHSSRRMSIDSLPLFCQGAEPFQVLIPETRFWQFRCIQWSGKKKQHKHKLFGPDFPRTFLTLPPGRPWVKKFLPVTGATEKRTFWCGRPRFLARTSMTRRVFEKLCTKKFALIFWPLNGQVILVRNICVSPGWLPKFVTFLLA